MLDENGNPILDPNGGEVTETPDGSQPEITTAGDGTTVNPEGAATLSPEEVEFNGLKGGTQDRIKAILHERDQWRQKAELFERSVGSYPPPPPPPSQSQVQSPDVATAVNKLSEIGMATKNDVQQQVQQGIGSLIYQFELDKLSSRYDGSNGLPAFSKEEYEDYVGRHPQFRNYTPEDVYQKMYADEIFDWKVQNQGKPTTARTTPSLRPTKTTVREEAWTPEYIEARLKEPDGPQWYDKNRDKVNSVVSKMADS